MRRAAVRFALSLVVLLGLVRASGAGDELESDDDVLSVVRVGDEVVAIDTERGLRQGRALRLRETLLGADARGRIGIARTSERLLGFSAGGAWSELDYSVDERMQPPAQTYLARSVALVVFPKRLAAFTATSAGWFQLPVAFDEAFKAVHSSRRLLAAVTSRRLLAVDSALAGFAEIPLAGDEAVLGASSADRAITITTSRRVLSYRAGSGRWDLLGDSRG